MKVGPADCTPIILSMWQSPQNVSMACFIATNSVPKTLVAIVDCFFEKHMIGYRFM